MMMMIYSGNEGAVEYVLKRRWGWWGRRALREPSIAEHANTADITALRCASFALNFTFHRGA